MNRQDRFVAGWLAVALLAVTSAGTAQVVGWRGDGSGKAPGAAAPVEWSETKNVAWAAEVGASYSSPVVVGDKVFVTAEPDVLVCVERDSGKVLWKKSNGFDQLPAELRDKNQKFETSCGYTTPTPTSDGKRIFASFGTGIVSAYDLDGNRLWITFIEQSAISPYGRSASPLLVGERLVVPVSHYVGLDAGTGKVVWEQKDAEAGYGSPVLTEIDKEPVVITPMGYALKPDDGTVLNDDLPTLGYTSPVVEGGVIYYVDTTTLAVTLSRQPDGKLAAKELWEQLLEGEYFASPVVHDGLVYVSNSAAEYAVFDAKTGDKVLAKTLEIPPAGKPGGSGPFIYPSFVLADKKLYISSTSGATFVLTPGKEYKEVARNVIGDDLHAAPVFAGKLALFRVGEKLICVKQ